MDDRLTTVMDLEARLTRMAQLAELYASREAIFGLPPTDYPQIELIQKTFDPYAQLWRICSEFTRSFTEWMDGPFTEIDGEVMQQVGPCLSLSDSLCGRMYRHCNQQLHVAIGRSALGALVDSRAML